MKAACRYCDGNTPDGTADTVADAADNKNVQGHFASGAGREKPCHHPGAPFYPVMLWMFPAGTGSGDKELMV